MLPTSLQPLATRIHTTSRTNKLLTTTAAALTLALLTPLARTAYHDYQTYLALGVGGLPHNPAGWLLALCLPAFAIKDQLSLTPYDDPSLEGAGESYLPPPLPPPRLGPRPRVGKHCLPQRQVADVAPLALRRRLEERFRQLGAVLEARGLGACRTSGLEKVGWGWYARPAPGEEGRWLGRAVQGTKGEFAHVHGQVDGTVHVILAPADAKKVVEAGWGQRHPFSGDKRQGLPVSYTFVYAPRDEQELELVLEILKAGAAFVLQKKDLFDL